MTLFIKLFNNLKKHSSKFFTLFFFIAFIVISLIIGFKKQDDSVKIETKESYFSNIEGKAFENQPNILFEEEEDRANVDLVTMAEIKLNVPIEDFKDGVFVNSQNKTDLIEKTKIYFNKYFPSSPVHPEILVSMAEANNFPLDMLLVQGHAESHMGTAGRAVLSKNPFNVGNVTAGDTIPVTVCGMYTNCLNSFEEGIQKFINLIRDCYMYENEVITIQKFVDRDFKTVRISSTCGGVGVGSRYMTDPNSKFKIGYLIQNNLNPIFL